jgi:predicted transcriptional regulator
MTETLTSTELNVLRLIITKYRLDKTSSVTKFAQQNGLDVTGIQEIINKFGERGLLNIVRKSSHRDIVLVTDKGIMFYNLRKLSAKLYNEELKDCADMFEKVYSDFKILIKEKNKEDVM